MCEGWWIVLWVVLGILGALLAFVVLWILFAAVVNLCVDTKKEYKKISKLHSFLYQSTLAFALKVMRVKVRFEGEELLPKEGRFLLISNHVSNFDALATAHVFRKRSLGAISKPSNFKTPLFGKTVLRCLYMPIDRDNARKAVKTINLAAEVIKTGEASMLVYPEGTRNKSAKGLLPFHNSVFKIAQKAACPIVVMSVRGSEKVHKKAPFHRSEVTLRILSVIEKEEVLAKKTVELGETVAATLTEDEKSFFAEQA